MDAASLTTSVTAAANLLAASHSTNELLLLAALFTQLGDTLNTIALQRSICEGNEN